eukprot:CAMPEP_0198222760 /NCGR_PEP_ID=MMETSP1445-20131203/89538_1 /TAXON_ID=36898 /ORGANISM="Pyramimonas sp., Strain CCMP2087" /LENGTH=74 /DNA_ID=CAMNT_0043901383 /DNA_START=468 /DNA_END=688 /DNA_ORIENTATION=+
MEEDETVLVSSGNEKRFHIGRFETVSVAELRERICERIVKVPTPETLEKANTVPTPEPGTETEATLSPLAEGIT